MTVIYKSIRATPSGVNGSGHPVPIPRGSRGHYRMPSRRTPLSSCSVGEQIRPCGRSEVAGTCFTTNLTQCFPASSAKNVSPSGGKRASRLASRLDNQQSCAGGQGVRPRHVVSMFRNSCGCNTAGFGGGLLSMPGRLSPGRSFSRSGPAAGDDCPCAA